MNPYAAHATTFAAYQSWQGTDCPVITTTAFTGTPVDYLILPGSARLKSDLSVGGFMPDSDFVFAALVSTFGNASADATKDALQNKEIDYLGHGYKVQTVSIAAGGLQLHVECKDLNQGA